MYTITEIRELAERELNELLWPATLPGLYAPATYFMQLGGKRIRPMLTLLAADIFGGSMQKAMGPALAMEVFHNFTLVHDDIMDDAPLRRGATTVHTKWDVSTAILSGDVMLIKAYALLCKDNPQSLSPLLCMFNKTATEVCEGQRMDMDFEKMKNVSIDQYLEMIRLKTSVLLGCCLYIGAITAKASEEDAQNIYAFGEALGISFQLQDDILDTWGDAKAFGKKNGGDILRNKKTFLSIKTLELATVTDKEKLLYLFTANEKKVADKIEQVIALYEKYNVRAIANNVMEKYFISAMEYLKKVTVDEEKKMHLNQLAAAIYNRTY